MYGVTGTMITDKIWMQNQADVAYFSGHGFEDGEIALRYDQTQRFDPSDELNNNEWEVDMDIMIFSACDQLSLCDDDTTSTGNPEGYDPRCQVTFGDTTAYDPDHPPTADNCQHCQLGADNYGGQKWRDLTRMAGGETVGPKIYLGYYNMAPYRSWESPNRDTQIINNLLSEMVLNYSHYDMNYDDWVQEWLEANLTISGNDPTNYDDSHPAAAIDASDPDNMAYWALVWDPQLGWHIPDHDEDGVVDPIYYDLSP